MAIPTNHFRIEHKEVPVGDGSYAKTVEELQQLWVFDADDEFVVKNVDLDEPMTDGEHFNHTYREWLNLPGAVNHAWRPVIHTKNGKTYGG